MIRFFDVLFSSLALLVLTPLLLPLMLVLRLTGEGKIFYRQERIGRGGRPFHVFKFATMLEASPNLPGGYLTQRNDPRVLPMGRVLRWTKINELPQLANVWRGEMSLVGPRPVAAVHYRNFTPAQRRAIAERRPGLTGLGSLVFRDEARLLAASGRDFDEFHAEVITPFKGELERWYAEHATLRTYFLVLGLTALSLVKSDIRFLRFFPGAPRPGGALRELLPV